MTSGLILHKKCDHVGCITDAHVGLRLCVPSEGQLVGAPGHMQKVLGIYLCPRHYHELDANKLFKQILGRQMEALFVNYAIKDKRRPPDFRNAWFEALTMNAPELWAHEKAKQRATRT